MILLSIILAIVLFIVISRPATGPFTKQLQLIRENTIGKIVIIGILIAIAFVWDSYMLSFLLLEKSLIKRISRFNCRRMENYYGKTYL